MMSALDAIKAINAARGDAIVIGTMTPNRYWDAVSEKPDLDLPVFGAMGKASSVGLGLALARPDRRVVVLDGDGALLMNLGTLVTIAEQQPANLVHFVFEDGAYVTTGGQPVPGAGKFTLADMARGAGIDESYELDDLEDLVSRLPEILTTQGPVFVALKVSHPDEQPEIRIGKTGEAMRRLAARLRDE